MNNDDIDLEALKRTLTEYRYNRPKQNYYDKWYGNDWRDADIPGWVDETVKQKKASKKPVTSQTVNPQPPKRKSVKKSIKVGSALANILNEID